MPTPSFTTLQNEARERAERFLAASAETLDPKEAAGWSLAAKNATSVAVSCETILKIRNGGGR